MPQSYEDANTPVGTLSNTKQQLTIQAQTQLRDGQFALGTAHFWLGIAILSTSKGVMSDKEARQTRTGGELLAFVW